ncbi:MAG: DUF488 domain-containing protein [Bacteroidetes bacterium]|nr:DUF488 domain-containing protein [Bacteroidota bacterium]MBS1975650.1 DUF488 domain-containing protein [Bacteroidota bacterium]
MIKIKRIYEPVDKTDGFRVLVDRLWPRGLSKEKAHCAKWLKEVAPSDELREWFGHEAGKWEEFKKKYSEELKHSTALIELKKIVEDHQTVTLLYGAKDEQHNQAVVLQTVLKN